jgi:hypothetical protein
VGAPKEPSGLGISYSEDRFANVAPGTLQDLAEEHLKRNNDPEVMQIADALENKLRGLDENDPEYEITLRAYLYVNDVIEASLARLLYAVDPSDLDSAPDA